MALKTTARLLALIAAASLCSETAAQRSMYRCSSEGRPYLSDRPCEGRPATGLAAIGPTPDTRRLLSAARGEPPVASAVEYLEYLSPLCAELNEGMRNGPARGLGARALSELQKSYRERCSDDEQNARKRLSEEKGKQRAARDDEARAEQAERARANLSREQCDEMHRIVHRRRQAAAAMSAGERADFGRFEANWKARCPPASG